MADPTVDFAVLNDDVRWADPYDSIDLLAAGIWYLHDLLVSRHPDCPLFKRVRLFGDQFERSKEIGREDDLQLTHEQIKSMIGEMNLLGTLGHSLWHLSSFSQTPGFAFELKELAQIGCGENAEGDTLRLRGQGFLFLAAAHIAKHGFDIEFIQRRGNDPTPDFFAFRDGNRFSCEATSRHPVCGELTSNEFFWSVIIDTVTKKARQFRKEEFQNGVVLIDCTPVWDAFDLGNLSIGGEIIYEIPDRVGPSRTGSAPLIRYDTSIAGERLRNLEEAIRDSGIHTLVLWKNRVEFFDDKFRREMKYGILGSLKGIPFWSFFEKAIAFPGPNVNVGW